jgi:hypothetical protein
MSEEVDVFFGADAVCRGDIVARCAHDLEYIDVADIIRTPRLYVPREGGGRKKTWCSSHGGRKQVDRDHMVGASGQLPARAAANMPQITPSK